MVKYYFCYNSKIQQNLKIFKIPQNAILRLIYPFIIYFKYALVCAVEHGKRQNFQVTITNSEKHCSRKPQLNYSINVWQYR